MPENNAVKEIISESYHKKPGSAPDKYFFIPDPHPEWARISGPKNGGGP
jgi:hypothetical protein